MDITFTGTVARLLLGLVIGVCIGATGIGGGVLVVPTLSLMLGLPATVCVGTASLYTFIAKVYAAYCHSLQKTIDWSLCLFVLIGALPGNAAAALWVTRKVVGEDASSPSVYQGKLRSFIAIVIICMAVLLLVNLLLKLRVRHNNEKEGHPVKLDSRPFLKRLLAVLFGVFTGALLGSTAIGGGVIIISGMIFIFGLSTRRAVGSSLFVGVALTLSTSVIYFSTSQVDYITAFIMAAGSLVGVHLGSSLSVRMPDRVLRAAIIILIIIAALIMLIK